MATSGCGHRIGAELRLANGVAASWGVDVEWAWPRDWGCVDFGQWHGGFLGCGGEVGLSGSGCGQEEVDVLRLANGVAACWGVDVEWAWPRRSGRGHGIGAALTLANGMAACWGVDVEWAWPMWI